jgi:hypothetical protein
MDQAREAVNEKVPRAAVSRDATVDELAIGG